MLRQRQLLGGLGVTWGANCGAASGCVQTQRRWVPNLVSKQVPVTVMQAQTEDVPYSYTVTLCKPETRTREVQVCRMVAEQQSREVLYRLRAETRTGVQVCRMVAEQQSGALHRLRTDADVQVCHMVAEQQSREVPYTVCVPETRDTASAGLSHGRRAAKPRSPLHRLRA